MRQIACLGQNEQETTDARWQKICTNAVDGRRSWHAAIVTRRCHSLATCLGPQKGWNFHIQNSKTGNRNCALEDNIRQKRGALSICGGKTKKKKRKKNNPLRTTLRGAIPSNATITSRWCTRFSGTVWNKQIHRTWIHEDNLQVFLFLASAGVQGTAKTLETITCHKLSPTIQIEAYCWNSGR